MIARYLSILAAGLLFGFGLALSGMTDANKVLGFLDVAGRWDPSLLFVLGGAVGVTVVAFRIVLRRPAPVLAARFHLAEEKSIDLPLVAGAAVFGVGWGISGYCPGPAIALLAAPNWEAGAFLPGLVLGLLLSRALVARGAATRAASAARAAAQEL